ncbi:MAG: tetraacyldisaccharide 4'-kinase [Candidatus Paracaedibacteraceae bacterium]|nr:tetraacyldisaccharide 4'-kinase [Candidatus Paracaedibacteraceae bacterium]
MTLKAPKFWQKKGLLSLILSPLGWLYGQIVAWRLRSHKNKVSVPVICVGNLTLGGAGKTPVVIALAQEFQRLGHTPHILSRGYGGKGYQVLRVETTQQTAAEVGDEALLLAEIAPTWVGADRYQSAQAAVAAGATLLIMDDGLQSPTLYQDFKIAVFDGQIPFFNKRIFPAGPLREDFSKGLQRIDYLVLNNFKDIPSWAVKLPCTLATTLSDQIPTKERYLAFAGIGYPEKFYWLLAKKGFNIIETHSFADHHFYSNQEINELIQKAKKIKAHLITTEKDLVKIPKDAKKNIQSLKIRLEADLTEIVNKVLKFF